MIKFIGLQDLQRNLILGLKWQCNYRIGCNWNVNGQQCITNNKTFHPLAQLHQKMTPIILNGGALQLPSRNISILVVQAPTKLNAKHIY